MSTLTVHLENDDQDIAIRTILDALHVKYEEANIMDETEYLLSSSANAAHLKKSIEQAERGDVVKINLNTLLPE